jgi:hypothetical protein
VIRKAEVIPVQEPTIEDRTKVYQAIGLLFKMDKKPIKKREIVNQTGLDDGIVHTSLVWLKRWKLIHNNGKSKRRWFPMRIPNAGICWTHGDRIKNGICETCERVAKYPYSKNKQASPAEAFV